MNNDNVNNNFFFFNDKCYFERCPVQRELEDRDTLSAARRQRLSSPTGSGSPADTSMYRKSLSERPKRASSGGPRFHERTAVAATNRTRQLASPLARRKDARAAVVGGVLAAPVRSPEVETTIYLSV